MRIRNSNPGRLALAAAVCMALLLGTLAQSSHVCGIAGSGAGAAVMVAESASGGGPCLVCLMSAPSTLPLLLVLILVLSLGPAPAATLRGCYRSLWYGFRLSVRPPPAL